MAKATKKQALGRGLSALLNDPKNDISSVNDAKADAIVGTIIELDLKHIEVNPYQPRTQFKEAQIQELAKSIQTLGVIQPITVRKIGFHRYQLLSGERRFRASKSIGLTTIPTYIRIANDQEALEMALVENIQREDLDPIEIALSYKRLIDEISLTQEQMSQRVGKKRSTIANYLRLLKLDPIIQTGIRDGFVSMGHGRAIINIESHKNQLEIYEQIISKNLSVRATEALVKKLKSNTTPNEHPQTNLTEKHRSGLKEISNFFGHKVDLTVSKNGKGKITIPFHSEEDYNRILKLIRGAQ
jgi:ParB family chromosome partitioning protein